MSTARQGAAAAMKSSPTALMAAKAGRGKMPISTAGKARSKQRGFSYAMVLVAVAVIGIVSEVAYLSTWRMIKVDREAELLFRGQAYRRAIESYYKANKVFPRSLE